MERFSLTIELGNAGMSTGYDVAEALRKVAQDIGYHGLVMLTEGIVRDPNGNTCGAWAIQREEDSQGAIVCGTAPFPCAACGKDKPDAPSLVMTFGDDGAPSYLCAECAATAEWSSKFEDAEAILLYALAGDGFEDDYCSSAMWGYLARIGRHLVTEDTQGFVSSRDCGTVERAEREFSSLYDDGYGMSEDDAIISDDRGGYFVTFGNKELGKFERESRALAAISLEARRTGFYPNAWLCSERGNINRRDYW